MLSGQTAMTSGTTVIASETPVDVGEIPCTDVGTAVFDIPLDDVNVPAANVVIDDTLPTVMHVSSRKLLSGSVRSINTGRTCALQMV